MRAATICKRPGCPFPATQRGYCASHAGAVLPSQPRPSASQQGYGKDWRAIRDRYLREHPWCVECGAVGTDVDHILPRKRGGSDDDSNLQTLCHSHHSAKTARENGWARAKVTR